MTKAALYCSGFREFAYSEFETGVDQETVKGIFWI
jgi:hypothetical protein